MTAFPEEAVDQKLNTDYHAVFAGSWRLRILRLIENLTMGAAAVDYRTESMHGARSPQAQRVMINWQSDSSLKGPGPRYRRNSQSVHRARELTGNKLWGGKILMKWLAIFGHACVIGGCYLVAWGINLLPVSDPTPLGILSRPLFWGLFSIFGGICANMHSTCRCLQSQNVNRCKADPTKKNVQRS